MQGYYDKQRLGVFHIDGSYGHQIHGKTFGNRKGIPAVVIHGGPGASMNEDHARYFDPEVYFIVLFDQRGTGGSTPAGALHHNTTQDILEDMERIREYLNISSWVVMGGSWGSTVALLYAQAYRDKVEALILRGVFLGRDGDVNEFLAESGMAAQTYPEEWEKFQNILPYEDQDNVISGYKKLIESKDAGRRETALTAWNRWEILCSFSPRISEQKLTEMAPDIEARAALIEMHYMLNNFFIEDNQILANINRLQGLDVYILQGSLDWVCPVHQAIALREALEKLPDTNVTMTAFNRGHAGSDPMMVHHIVSATKAVAGDKLAKTEEVSQPQTSSSWSPAIKYAALAATVGVGLFAVSRLLNGSGSRPNINR